jgi:hypothetical protein
MRWIIPTFKPRPKPVLPEPGTIRHIFDRFLWFPKKIGREFRWMEKASWSETYAIDSIFTNGVEIKVPRSWYPLKNECFIKNYKWKSDRWETLD